MNHPFKVFVKKNLHYKCSSPRLPKTTSTPIADSTPCAKKYKRFNFLALPGHPGQHSPSAKTGETPSPQFGGAHTSPRHFAGLVGGGTSK